MKLSEKFETAEIFLEYSKKLSGYTFDEPAMLAWYAANTDFVLTYTGIVKQLKPLVTGVAIPAKQHV